MKKIFLTSGLVLCLACPALATTDISGSANSASCVEDTLGVDSGSTSFEAKWTAKTYNITYGCGTGTGTTSVTGNPEHPIYGETYIFPSLATGCSKTGYHVTSWNCGQSFGGDHLVGSSITWNYDMSGNPVATTCAANWTANATDITYSCGNGATGTPATPLTGNALYGESYTYTTVGTCAKSGYAFAGWDCGETGYTNKAANSTETWSYTGDHGGSMTCTAIWNASHTVTYVAGSGCKGPSPSYFDTPTSGSGYTFVSAADAGIVANTGYSFTGWSCSRKLGNKAAGELINSWNIDADVTCTAQCSGNTIALNYSANCGNSTDTNCTNWSEDATCTFGNTFNLPTQPTRQGYTFTGWLIQSALSQVDASINGAHHYSRNPWDNCFDELDEQLCSDSHYSDLNGSSWKVQFSYGTVYGKSICSDRSGRNYGRTGNPGSEDGDDCWCKVTGVVPSGGGYAQSVSAPWVYNSLMEGDCSDICVRECADAIKDDSAFRSTAYGH